MLKFLQGLLIKYYNLQIQNKVPKKKKKVSKKNKSKKKINKKRKKTNKKETKVVDNSDDDYESDSYKDFNTKKPLTKWEDDSKVSFIVVFAHKLSLVFDCP